MSYEGPHPFPVASGGTGRATLTAHDLVVGNGTSAVTLVAPSSTSGVPVVSQGASADPAFGTAVVAGGGTGQTTLTAHSVLVGNGTTAITQVGPSATAGSVLLSTGSTTDPGFVAPTAGTGLSVTTNGSTLSYALSTPVSIANGGTNATSFATTDGVVYYDGTRLVTTSAGTSGQVLTSNGAGVAPTYQASQGKLVLIQSQTASASSTINFTTGITNTYTTYLFVFTAIVSSAGGADFEMLVSTNGGSSYLATGYSSGLNFNTYNSATLTNQNVSTYFKIFTGVAAGTNYFSGTVWCYNITTANNPMIIGQLFGGNGPYLQQIMGLNSTTSGVNAFQFLFGSGNITSGTITLFGVKES